LIGKFGRAIGFKDNYETGQHDGKTKQEEEEKVILGFHW